MDSCNKIVPKSNQKGYLSFGVKEVKIAIFPEQGNNNLMWVG
jgi:hypothetical protein